MTRLVSSVRAVLTYLLYETFGRSCNRAYLYVNAKYGHVILRTLPVPNTIIPPAPPFILPVPVYEYEDFR